MDGETVKMLSGLVQAHLHVTQIQAVVEAAKLPPGHYVVPYKDKEYVVRLYGMFGAEVVGEVVK